MTYLVGPMAELTAIALGFLSLAATLITVAGLGWRKFRLLLDVRTVVLGEPERRVAGVLIPARPGIGERLEKIEKQVNPDSGNSLYDRVQYAVGVCEVTHREVARHVSSPLHAVHQEGE